MKMKVLLLLMIVMVTMTVAARDINKLEWGSLDPSIQGFWYTAAYSLTQQECVSENVGSCLTKLPYCRPLLYYSNPFTDLTYSLFTRYLQDCNQQTESGLTMDAFPQTITEWQEKNPDGMQMIYDLGLTQDNLHDMFYCLHLKFNNVNAFKDCINTTDD